MGPRHPKLMEAEYRTLYTTGRTPADFQVHPALVTFLSHDEPEGAVLINTLSLISSTQDLGPYTLIFGSPQWFFSRPNYYCSMEVRLMMQHSTWYKHFSGIVPFRYSLRRGSVDSGLDKDRSLSHSPKA